MTIAIFEIDRFDVIRVHTEREMPKTRVFEFIVLDICYSSLNVFLEVVNFTHKFGFLFLAKKAHWVDWVSSLLGKSDR